MNTPLLRRYVLLIALGAGTLHAVTRYVSPMGGNVAPYTDWAGAATTIEAAVKAAAAGDTIIVSNGVYTPAAGIVLSNAAITIQSLNGSDTAIVNGGGSFTPFNVKDGSALIGLMISNGVAVGDSVGGGVNLENGRLENCVIVYCGAQFGGGVFVGQRGIVRNCRIHGNFATHAGGGALIVGNGMIADSLLFENMVIDTGPLDELYFGGGGLLSFFGGVAWHCVVSNNLSAALGGGVSVIGSNLLQRCHITGNAAFENGGGVYCHDDGLLQSCLIDGNMAYNGGGVYCLTNARLHNCTIVSNSATVGGGFFFELGGTNLNGIAFFNSAVTGANYHIAANGRILYTCTTPAVSNIYDGRGCIASDPGFINPLLGDFRLPAASACVDSGTNLPGMRLLQDFVGNIRVSNRVDLGAYELSIPAPTVVITSTIASLTFDTDWLRVAGTNTLGLTGSLWVFNNANGVLSNFVRAGDNWYADAVPLNVGSNLIVVAGSNDEGYVAADAMHVLRGVPGTGVPYVDITNDHIAVTYDAAGFFVSGTNNLNVIGDLWLTNHANGYSDHFESTPEDWFSIYVPLAIGTNVIYVYCTNLVGTVTNDMMYAIRLTATGVPFVDITSDVARVDYDVTSISVAGTNNGQSAGIMWVTNAVLGSIAFLAANAWVTPPVPLLPGTNTIWVFTSNLVNQVAADMIAIVRDAPGSGTPFVDCTNANITVAHVVVAFVCAGTNNANVVGGMRVRNQVTGEEHGFAAAAAWQAPPISLQLGINDISVYGTNAAGAMAEDIVLITRKGPATGPAFVQVLSPPATVTFDVAQTVVFGTNNPEVVGAMWISNAANQAVRYFAARPSWTSAPIALAVGVNTLWVYGQNADGSQAWDHVTITRDIPGTGLPCVFITNGDEFVSFDVASYALAGTNNANVLAGAGMWAINANNAATVMFVNAASWVAPPLPLEIGMNLLRVYATNMYGQATNDEAVVVRQPAGSGVPFLDILTGNTNVAFATIVLSLHGTNNANIIGGMGISNAQNGARADFSAAAAWTTPPIALEIGWNDLHVWGTNLARQATSDTVRVTRGSPGTGDPIITMLSTNASFTHDTVAFNAEGSISFDVAGDLWVSNEANGVVLSFPAVELWTAPAVPLDVGTNIIRVYGTNLLAVATNASVRIVRGIPGSGAPYVCITSTVTMVRYDTAVIAIAGTNDPDVVGGMWASNDAVASAVSFPAAGGWTTPSIALERHINTITVYGTNLAGNVGQATIVIDRVVPDNATNYVAASGSHTWPFLSWATAATNLNDAINEAGLSNVVIVADGTNFCDTPLTIQRPLTLESVNGAEAAFISATPLLEGSLVRMNAGVLDGFTLGTLGNGAATNGGGVFLDGTGSVRNCTIVGFSAEDSGGGIYCRQGQVSNCVIRDCSAIYGGGIFIELDGAIEDTICDNNTAASGGGAYLVFGGLIRNSVFIGNRAQSVDALGLHRPADAALQFSENRGGGLFMNNGGLAYACLFERNQADYGAGVYIISNGELADSTIRDNTAAYYAAVYVQYGGVVHACTIVNNTALTAAGLALDSNGSADNTLIAHNRAAIAGGAYVLGDVILENCTIADNDASMRIGGLAAAGNAVVRNAIIYHNTAPIHPNYSNIYGSIIYQYCCMTPSADGPGTVTNDPRVARHDTGYYRLASDSPCIDAGTNFVWMLYSRDLRDYPRIINGAVDIGAYEATNEPVIWTMPVHVDFGAVALDEMASASVVIGNAGDQTLVGTASNIVPPFAVVAGAPYSIAPATQQNIELAFTPTNVQRYTMMTLLTGGGDAPILLTGEGVPEPALLVLLPVLLGWRRGYRRNS